jgi:hypothetical protein
MCATQAFAAGSSKIWSKAQQEIYDELSIDLALKDAFRKWVS